MYAFAMLFEEDIKSLLLKPSPKIIFKKPCQFVLSKMVACACLNLSNCSSLKEIDTFLVAKSRPVNIE